MPPLNTALPETSFPPFLPPLYKYATPNTTFVHGSYRFNLQALTNSDTSQVVD